MFVEGLGWGLPSEDLPGACVDRCFDRSELLGVPARQVGALGEVLAQQAICVLVGAALPGAVGVSEEDRDAGLDLERGVGRKLLAAVPSQGSTQTFGECGHSLGEGVLHRDGAVARQRGTVLGRVLVAVALLSGEVDELGVAGRAFDERADGRVRWSV